MLSSLILYYNAICGGIVKLFWTVWKLVEHWKWRGNIYNAICWIRYYQAICFLNLFFYFICLFKCLNVLCQVWVLSEQFHKHVDVDVDVDDAATATTTTHQLLLQQQRSCCYNNNLVHIMRQFLMLFGQDGVFIWCPCTHQKRSFMAVGVTT